jgi:hypothetical protein
VWYIIKLSVLNCIKPSLAEDDLAQATMPTYKTGPEKQQF